MRNRSRVRPLIQAAMEAIEPRRLLSTVTGTVFTDTNRNGRLDTGEAGAGARTVFVDYDYNGVVNGSDPVAMTDATGKYTLTTRSTNVSVRVVTRPNESISLPYGATSIWLSTISGTVAGKNIGIATSATTTLTGRVYADANNNGAYDVGEGSALASVFADLNNDGKRDTGEPVAATYLSGSGLYQLQNVPIGVSFVVRASNGSSDSVQTQPSGFAGYALTTTAAAIANLNFGFTEFGGKISGFVFRDNNYNGTRESGEPEAYTEHVWIDLNRNALEDPGEPTPFYSLGMGAGPDDIAGLYTMRLSLGTWRLAMRANNDTDLVADQHNEITISSNGQEVQFTFAVPPVATPLVTGTVFSDTNRNGRLDIGESRLPGRTVFADYNYNRQLDAGEPSVFTDSTGLYVLPTRATQVSVRLVLNVNEIISLPYGATSIWLSNVNGTVSGKNLGVKVAAPATSVLTGFVYLDSNGNGRRDAGELPPYGVSIGATVDGMYIAGSLSETTGEYRFANVPVGATAILTVSLVNDDTTESYLLVEPHFTSPRRTVVAQAVAQTSAGDFRFTDSFNRIISVAFKDLDGNNFRGLYDPDMELADRWLDVNANGLHDAGDLPLLGSPTYANNNTRPYAYLNVPAGTWRIAMRRAGDTDLIADEIKVVSFAGVNQTGNAFFISQPTLPVISGVVFSDDNGNGVQDAGEGGLSTFRSFGIFVDYNDNHYQDANEPDVQSEFDGQFFFESAQAGTVYVDMSASLKAQTFPASATTGQRFDPGAGQVSGLRFGYRDQSSGWVNGSVFIDVNHNGRRDADDLDAGGRLVYADYNFNGRFDASEAAAYTNQYGSYHLATRGTNLSIRIALVPGELISLPYGAESLWIQSVETFVYGKNLGLIFTPHE